MSLNKEPFVSVIIPTYNRADLLLKTIDSILRQSYKSIEIIIVDDGSDDKTKASLLALNESRIIYINQGHLGDIARLRNIGIEKSKGDFIAFCDDDDTWNNNKLKIQLEYAYEYNFICSNGFLIDENDKIISNKVITDSSGNKEISIFSMFKGNGVITSSVLLNKKILNKTFNEKNSNASAEDYELWLRLIYKNKCFFVDEPLINFRKHNNTTTFEKGEKFIEILYSVIRILSGYVNDKDPQIAAFARYGLVSKRKELASICLHNRYYKKSLQNIIQCIMDCSNVNFILLFLKVKLKMYK